MATTRDLAALPKAHLHLHLEGTMRPATLDELCERYGVERPEDTRGKRFANFGGFNSLYWAATQCLRTRDDLERVLYEVAEDAVAHGCWWMEPAFDTERYSTLRADSPYRLFESQREGWDFMLAAAARTSKALGIGIAYVSAIDRTQPMTSAMARAGVTADVARDEAHWYEGSVDGEVLRLPGIAAIGLHSNEAGHPPEPFADAFRLATDGTGLKSAPHAGEIEAAPGEGVASVRGALDTLRPDRLAHGVLSIEDEALVTRLAAERVCLDVCPTSNILLSVFPSLAEHPLPQLIAAGVPCSIGSDDALLFGPGLLEEFELCRSEMGLSDEQLAGLARDSFEFSAAPDEVRERGMQAAANWLKVS